MTCGIYIITNNINSIFYIGSSLNVENRFKQHKTHLKYNKHCNQKLQHAYNKYGLDNFDFSILEVVKISNDLLIREQYWVDRLKAVKYGYNIRSHVSSSLGLKLTDEHKEKLRRIMLGNNYAKGRKNTPEQLEVIRKISKINSNKPEFKKAMSERMKGNTHTLGFKHSDETKKLMSSKRLGVKKSEETKAKMKIAAKKREAEKYYQVAWIEPAWLTEWKLNNAK